MIDDIIEQLTKIYLKEIDKEQEKFIITKRDLVNICLKMMKVIRGVENE